MPPNIDHKSLRDLLSDDSDSDSFVGIYEYPETTQELTCKYPTSSTRYTGSSTKKSSLASSSAYDDQRRRRNVLFTDRQRYEDFPNDHTYAQDRTDREISSAFQDTSTSLFGRSFEEASFDFLQQVRPRRSGRHDVTPSLTSDDTRTGSSSSRFGSPTSVSHRHRSPARRVPREISHVSDSTVHIHDIREDATVSLPSIRELDQNINGASIPVPPSPPGYAGRREYERRDNRKSPTTSPVSLPWHSRHPNEKHDQIVNNPIPRFVSPEPYSRLRYPAKEDNSRENCPSSQCKDQNSTREFEERKEYPTQWITGDIHSKPSYPQRGFDERRTSVRTINAALEPLTSPIYTETQHHQRLEYTSVRNVSPDPLSSSSINEQSEKQKDYLLTRNLSSGVSEASLSPLYGNYSHAQTLSPESRATSRDLNSWPEQKENCPELSPLSLYPDFSLEQESVRDINRLASPGLPVPTRTIGSQSERRNNYGLGHTILSRPPSATPHADLLTVQKVGHYHTLLSTPAPLQTQTLSSVGTQPVQNIIRVTTPTPALSLVKLNRQPERRTDQSLISGPAVLSPTLASTQYHREPQEQRTSLPLVPPPTDPDANSVAFNKELEQKTTRPHLFSSPAPRPSSILKTSKKPVKETDWPAPRVATPERPLLPHYHDERAANFIESLLDNLDIPDASRKAILENNRISTWDFSSVHPPTVTIEVLAPAQQNNKRKASYPNASKPPKVPKAPKHLKVPKPPKASIPLPASEETEVDELAGDDADFGVLPSTAASVLSERPKTGKKPAVAGSFVCEYCATPFTRNHDRRRHIKTIHQEQTVSAIQSRTCPCCNEVLSREDAFRRHILKVPDSCIRLAELRSMPLTHDQKKRLLKMHEDGIPPRFPFDELFYMYKR